MSTITAQQRKEQTEKILAKRKIKINPNLPLTETEKETKIRSAEEVSTRLVILTAVNFVAFDHFTSKEITKYLKDFELWDQVTPGEKAFLANPTEEKKSQESWKVECIWVLLWALNIIDELEFPEEPADLDEVPEDDFPFGGLDADPNGFIAHYTDIRTKEEILDEADLYYRIDWACVDARINDGEVENVHPGVVYERHYALNWLVNYMNQEWDDVSCDT